MEQDAESSAVAATGSDGSDHFIFEQGSPPVTAGEDGVPPDAFEWLDGRETVDTARLLPERANGVLGFSASAAMAQDQDVVAHNGVLDFSASAAMAHDQGADIYI